MSLNNASNSIPDTKNGPFNLNEVCGSLAHIALNRVASLHHLTFRQADIQHIVQALREVYSLAMHLLPSVNGNELVIYRALPVTVAGLRVAALYDHRGVMGISVSPAILDGETVFAIGFELRQRRDLASSYPVEDANI